MAIASLTPLFSWMKGVPPGIYPSSRQPKKPVMGAAPMGIFHIANIRRFDVAWIGDLAVTMWRQTIWQTVVWRSAIQIWRWMPYGKIWRFPYFHVWLDLHRCLERWRRRGVKWRLLLKSLWRVLGVDYPFVFSGVLSPGHQLRWSTDFYIQFHLRIFFQRKHPSRWHSSKLHGLKKSVVVEFLVSWFCLCFLWVHFDVSFAFVALAQYLGEQTRSAPAGLFVKILWVGWEGFISLFPFPFVCNFRVLRKI